MRRALRIGDYFLEHGIAALTGPDEEIRAAQRWSKPPRTRHDYSAGPPPRPTWSPEHGRRCCPCRVPTGDAWGLCERAPTHDRAVGRPASPVYEVHPDLISSAPVQRGPVFNRIGGGLRGRGTAKPRGSSRSWRGSPHDRARRSSLAHAGLHGLPSTLMDQSLMTPQCPAPITREDVMTVSDVAGLLRLSTYTVKEYARRQLLPGRKLGRSWRFFWPELEEAIRQLPQPH